MYLRGEELLLLFMRAELLHRATVERVVDAHDDTGAGATTRDLLEADRVREVIEAWRWTRRGREWWDESDRQ